jgi:hypothetical protein
LKPTQSGFGAARDPIVDGKKPTQEAGVWGAFGPKRLCNGRSLEERRAIADPSWARALRAVRSLDRAETPPIFLPQGGVLSRIAASEGSLKATRHSGDPPVTMLFLPPAETFSVYVAFRRGQLTMKRGIVDLQTAIRFAEQALSLRFRNHDQLFVMDDRTREIVWRGGAVQPTAPAIEARGETVDEAEAPARVAPEIVARPVRPEAEHEVTRVAVQAPPAQDFEVRFERMKRALHAAREAHQRCARVLRDKLAPLPPLPAATQEILERTARLREHGERTAAAFARSITVLEGRVEQLSATKRAPESSPGLRRAEIRRAVSEARANVVSRGRPPTGR